MALVSITMTVSHVLLGGLLGSTPLLMAVGRYCSAGLGSPWKTKASPPVSELHQDSKRLGNCLGSIFGSFPKSGTP